MSKSNKVIVTVAPTGGMVKKSQTPHLPTQPAEIAASVKRSYDEGASIVAVHARIRDVCDIIINNSTGGGVDGDMTREIEPGLHEIMFAERMKGLDAGAEMATFDAHTVLASFGGREILVNTSPQRCDLMAQRFIETGIKPEWECFCLPHLMQDPLRLIKGGFDKAPYWINFVLGGERGFQNASPYTPAVLDQLVAHLPEGALFCVSGIGRAQFPATRAAQHPA